MLLFDYGFCFLFFFFKQKTAYEMRISDWSSDVCSSDLRWGIARYQDHGVLMIGPLLMRYGTAQQRERYLPPILAARHIWCQGYSEPNAGSDLASLQTLATLTQSNGKAGFLINGQKIWTTDRKSTRLNSSH